MQCLIFSKERYTYVFEEIIVCINRYDQFFVDAMFTHFVHVNNVTVVIIFVNAMLTHYVSVNNVNHCDLFFTCNVNSLCPC